MNKLILLSENTMSIYKEWVSHSLFSFKDIIWKNLTISYFVVNNKNNF